MRNVAYVLALGSSLILGGCARRVPVSAGPPGIPRIGWVLMHGDRDTPDREFACQSVAPANCVVPASRPNAQVFTAIYFYFHSTTSDTKYAGPIQIGFFNGEKPYELRTDVTVKAKGPAGNQSVTGVAASRPGTYRLTMAVDATSAPGGTPIRQIREDVQITVR